MSSGLSVQEKKLKIDFKHGGHGSHLGFPIGTILTFLCTSHPDASYQVSIQLALQSKNTDFQDGGHSGHLGFPIEIILANFDLQVTPPPFGSGVYAKNRSTRWPLRASWITDRNDYILYIFIYRSPRCFLPSFKSVGLSNQEKSEK